MDKSYAEIAEALRAYFDGFYECDAHKLKQIFHDRCHLFSATGGPLVDDDMETVYKRLGARTPGSKTGEVRLDRILSIDMSGPESALVKLQIAIGSKLYTDYLSLLKLDGRWKIISKTYTWVPREQAAARQAAE
jgi:4-oxalocrotonate tautomerase